ncbi:retron Ec67 family RNA-directed DNA polymerase/endonuclease [Rhizobium mongolense]|uniref:RNA-directed DNA polymerase n=1 Tax=Rhizobium mongolense TaxID=57676 RepID=A0A7W6WD93_9HYPH|nr:retron Ec67 family RNA-directed DNA polymerase/endonuclease [Rhizobium mongolense]MBB4274132.1 retron-type reverse transcriptase [Rhizobium mongolense]
MSFELVALKNAVDLTDVAVLLGVKPKDLSYALYIQPSSAKYRAFEIPKKGGGFRLITAPEPRLRSIQRRLADLLLTIQQELEVQRTKSKGIVAAHGFKKSLSIITNARCHRGKSFVFNGDLKDFFPSMNFGRVYGFFLKNRDFELHPKVATVLAQIACFENRLPQGSPCSPVISNFIAGILDRHLSKLAAENRCTYTRYADDLTFSTNEAIFPEQVARLVRGANDKWVAGYELAGRVARSGFQINELKTRLQYRNSRQDVTGLVVNEKLNVPSEYYKLARAMCHHLFKDGTAFRTIDGIKIPVSDERVRGILSHIHHVRTSQGGPKHPPGDPKAPGHQKLYRRFLDYVSFFGHQQPTIICEGKTDNVYIKTAMQMLAPKFPDLVEVAGNKFDLKVKFFKYGRASAQIQNLGGGSGALKTLLMEYEKRLKGFAGTASQPVIMVLDVDKGTTQIWSEISKILGTAVAGHGPDPFYHVRNNLYVVPIPAKPGVETCIEDLFDAKTLAIPHDGKVFDKESDKDKPGTYSKNTFANQVVRENRHSIDFSGFEPLLEAINAAIKNYSTKVAAMTA